jgi:outer membrane protein
MKKIILGLSLVLAASFANAQFSKGNIYVTGDVGFHSENDKNDDTKHSGYHFSPAVSYLVTSNVAVGAKLNIGGEKTQIGSVSSDSTSTGFGVFGRYYFTPANKFSLFANLGFDYNTTKPVSSVDFKSNEMSIGLSAGMNYFVSNHLSLEASFGKLGYTSEKSNLSGDKGTSTFGLDLDMSSLSFGLNYKF